MKKAWIFPGQASQKIGMGKDLYENTEIGKKYYKIANEILEVDIQSISFDGPEERLRKTNYTQPAIYIVSTIISHIMLDNGFSPDAVSGHSLGEYSAIAASGGFNFEVGLELVKIRSESMHNAGKINPGTMAAIIGMTAEQVRELCNSNNTKNVLVAANYNTINQIVISGNIDSVENFSLIAKEHGAKMIIPLNVSGAFHSPLMRPAREELADKLDSIEISDIKIPFYSNFDAKPKTKGKDIKNSLVNQLENPVLWYDTINNMTNDGCSSYIEIGPGKVLQGLNRKIDKSLSNIGIQTHQDIMKYEI
tara:strand:+ start:3444 stop:4364 length:921 start_codon:yes stop_codon:yes gene_type:complete